MNDLGIQVYKPHSQRLHFLTPPTPPPFPRPLILFDKVFILDYIFLRWKQVWLSSTQWNRNSGGFGTVVIAASSISSITRSARMGMKGVHRTSMKYLFISIMDNKLSVSWYLPFFCWKLFKANPQCFTPRQVCSPHTNDIFWVFLRKVWCGKRPIWFKKMTATNWGES